MSALDPTSSRPSGAENPGKRARWPQVLAGASRWTPRNLPAWPAWLSGLAILAVFAVYVSYVGANYYLKPYSDPIHWLEFARDLAGQWSKTPFAPGYPIFLWAMLKIAGPYHVFLVNAPLLILLSLLVVGLTARALAETEPRAHALLGGAAALCLLFYVDPYILLYLVNPYREPFVYVLTCAALLLMISASQSPEGRGWRVAIAGFLVGFSYSTRETAVLFLPAVALYGLGTSLWCRRGSGWRPALLFALGLGLGAVPALLHNWAFAGNVVVPSYSASKGRLLPGLHVRALHWTSSLALRYYLHMGPVVLSAMGLGLVYAAWRRSRILLLLVLPALLCNAGFFVFYDTFVVRYFFVCHLFMVIFMACGFTALVSVVLGRWRSGRFVAPVLAAGLCVLTGVTVSRMASLRSERPPFQIPDAKRFVADVEERVPPGSLILAPRVVCEILNWFTHAESYPTVTAAYQEGTIDEEVLRARVQAELDRGRQVFLLQVSERPEHVPTFDDTPLGQFVHREIRAYGTAEYGLIGAQGDADLVLYALEGPWTKTVVRQTLQSPTAAGAILRFNAWDLWGTGGTRQSAVLRINGQAVEAPLRNGANFVAVSGLSGHATVALEIESDQPLPENLQAEFLDPAKPVLLDLREHALPSCADLLSGAFAHVPGGSEKGVLLSGAGAVRLPTPWRDPHLLVAQLYLLSASEHAGGKYEVVLETRDPARSVAAAVPADLARRAYTTCVLSLDGDEDESIQLTAVPPALNAGANAPTGSVEGVILERIEVTYRPLEARAAIDVSEADDKCFLGTGWHAPGRLSKKQWGSWSSESADLEFYLKPIDADYVVRLHTLSGYRPAHAPPENLAVKVNGIPVPLQGETAPKGREWVHVAAVPRSSLRLGLNRVTVTADPWVPAQVTDSHDKRRLGVLLVRAVLEPGAASP